MIVGLLCRCTEIIVGTCVFMHLYLCLSSIGSSRRENDSQGLPPPTPQHNTNTHTHNQIRLVHSDSIRENTLRQTISMRSTRPGGVNTGLERKYQHSPPLTCCFFRGMSPYVGLFIKSVCVCVIKPSLIF